MHYHSRPIWSVNWNGFYYSSHKLKYSSIPHMTSTEVILWFEVKCDHFPAWVIAILKGLTKFKPHAYSITYKEDKYGHPYTFSVWRTLNSEDPWHWNSPAATFDESLQIRLFQDPSLTVIETQCLLFGPNLICYTKCPTVKLTELINKLLPVIYFNKGHPSLKVFFDQINIWYHD